MGSRTGPSLSFKLLGLAAALVASVLAAHPGQAVGSPSCVGEGITTYYSSASHSTEVGQCATGCCTGCPGDYCGCRCTGTTSAYFIHELTFCPDIACRGPLS